jgi:hypothetical protein
MVKKKYPHVRVSANAHKLLRFIADDEETTMSKLVDKLLKGYVWKKTDKELKG